MISKYKSDIYVAAHLLLGMAASFNQTLIFVWVSGVFLLGVYCALLDSVRYPAYLFAAYLIGIELLGRMSSAGLPHEFIKYAVSAILIIAIIRSGRRLSSSFILFILVLLPAVFLTDGGNQEATRQFISANLSGPICLGISVLYFYNRPINVPQIKKVFVTILYPLAAILGYLILKTPDFSEIDFGYQSNFATSLYGPNQMSSILGLGILIIGLSYILKLRLFGSHLMAFGFVSFLLFRGLLTFSRGGMLTPVILLVIIIIYYSWKAAGFNKSTIRIITISILFTALAIFLFRYADDITGNKLGDRYSGKKRGVQIEGLDKLTSGRTVIVMLDWKIFLDHPVLGAGVGMGKFLRVKAGYFTEVSAHNEFSRILAEHGLFGVVALIILLFAPLTRFFRVKIPERIFIIAFVGFCFVFMTHAATRIAAPCFLYGLAFINIIPGVVSKRNPQKRKINLATPVKEIKIA